MKIAIASGKGGTGKTTVSTNLVLAFAALGMGVAYLDCDVEEPNGALFLRPEITARRDAIRTYPQVDADKCTGCGRCGEVCQFSAIVCLGGKVLVYPELCRSCGGCQLACPSGAIRELPKTTGVIESGQAGGVRFVQGVLRIGEPMAVPVIREVKREIRQEAWTILDCPPGTSCPVVESVRETDWVLLVTEPTPFGLHDLKLAVEMARALHRPLAVVVNRAGIGDRMVHEYCASEGIEIWAEIADARPVAEAYAHGQMAYEAVPEFRASIDTLVEQIQKVAKGATAEGAR